MNVPEKKENPASLRWGQIRAACLLLCGWGTVQTLGFIAASYPPAMFGIGLLFLPMVIFVLINGEVDASKLYFIGHRTPEAMRRARIPAYGILALMGAAAVAGAYAAIGINALSYAAIALIVLVILFTTPSKKQRRR